MTNEIRFDNSEFISLGIHFQAQSWTFEELAQISQEYQAPGLQQLLDICVRFGIVDPQAKVLSTYTNKADRAVYFSLPRVHLNKAGEFVLFIGDNEIPLTYENKLYKAVDDSFKVVPRRKDPKDNKSPINGINLVAIITQESLEGIDEEFNLVIPVKCKRDSDLAGVTKALQSGDTTHEALVQLGKGSGALEPFYKPWMLPKGFYRIEGETVNCKHLPTGGVIWEGSVKSLSDDTSYKTKMNAAPFIVQQRNTLLLAAQNDAPVYLLIDGAYETSVGIGAIAHACRLQEINGDVPVAMMASFQAEAKRLCAATASKNAGKLLSDAKIAELRTEFELNEQARIAEWVAKQDAKPANAPTGELVAAGSVPDGDEIPF